MSMIEGLFTQTATIKRYIRDVDGEPKYGDPETVRCRIEINDELVSGRSNVAGVRDTVIAHAKMFCCCEKIPQRSIVEYDGEEYIVLNCAVCLGFGFSHLEVMLE